MFINITKQPAKSCIPDAFGIAVFVCPVAIKQILTAQIRWTARLE